jgi:D-glycero-alpha-D-manno-heptose-7-phosphate kinase
MILVRAPMRVSIFGACDYLEYIKEYGGISVGFSIDKYSYIASRILPPYFNYKSRITYNEIEHVKDNRDIKHDAIREVIKYLGKIEQPLEICHYSDAPSYSSLGSSSAFIIALLKSLADFEWENEDLINTAFHIEHDLMKKNVGLQDATYATIGSIGGFRFHYRGENNINPIEVRYRFFPGSVEQFFNNCGLLFFTGISRNSSDIVGKYVNNLVENEWQHSIHDLAEKAYSKLLNGCTDIETISYFLNWSWACKKKVSPHIMTPELCSLEKKIGELPISAMRLLGGGGGGSFFILGKPEFHGEVISSCKELGMVHIPYKVGGGAERIL